MFITITFIYAKRTLASTDVIKLSGYTPKINGDVSV